MASEKAMEAIKLLRALGPRDVAEAIEATDKQKEEIRKEARAQCQRLNSESKFLRALGRRLDGGNGADRKKTKAKA